MRKTLSVLAIIAALSSSAYADPTYSGTFSGGTIDEGEFYHGTGDVTIAEGPVSGISTVWGKDSNEDSITGAKVTMTGGSVGYLYGGFSYLEDVISNTVSVSGGEVNYISGGESTMGNATSNTVTISGGEVNESVHGAAVWDNGSANGNTVVISGGEVNALVYGAFLCGEGSANDNTVTISGGTFDTEQYIYVVSNQCAGDTYSGNTMNLVGEGGQLGQLTGSQLELGGLTGDPGNAATLNVYGKNVTVSHIVGGFGSYNFYLSSSIQSGDTMLTLSQGWFDAKELSVKCSGATQLTTGDTVTLVHAADPDGGVLLSCIAKVDIIQGVSASYSGTVSVSGDDKDLVLTVGNGSGSGPVVPMVADNTLKSMTETRTDVAALVNSAADFMATTGVQQAKLAAKVAALTGKDGVAPFVALGGSSMRYNTGSHVDADGFNGALGVAKAFGATTLGIAGEYGISSYKSHVGRTNAKGDSKLYGGALLADWQGKQGWHAESALRLGRTFTDYSAMTALGGTHYTDHASYQGIMLGGGKEMKVSKKSDDTIDLYARYFYGHTNASHTTATSGEGIHFSSVNSHRTMVGARYNHELTDTATLYAGAAWMHEFDGDAHSVIGGFTSPSPSLKGDSGMVEIGTTFAPFAAENILLNLNLQGWTGVQRGITGGAGCTIKF